MAYGTPTDPVGGTVITVAYAVANILDPLRWIRLMTGNADPPGSSYVVVSDSTTGTTWKKVPADALAAGVAVANLGYTPLNKDGDTITKNTGVVDAGLYGRAGLSLHTTDGSRPALAFVRDGTGAAALYYESGTTFGIETSGGTIVGLLTTSSAVNAATLDSLDSTQFARLDAASNFAVAPAIGGETIITSGNDGTLCNAATAADALALGGILAASYGQRKIISWSGAGGSGAQQVTGFACSAAIVVGRSSGNTSVIAVLLSTTAANNAKVAGTGTTIAITAQTTSRLHASDGIITDATDGTDAVGYTYQALCFG